MYFSVGSGSYMCMYVAIIDIYKIIIMCMHDVAISL